MMNEEKNQVEQDTIDETELDEVNGGLATQAINEELMSKKIENKLRKLREGKTAGAGNPTPFLKETYSS